MNTSCSSHMGSISRIAAIGLLVMTVGGCADMVSNSKASRREGVRQYEAGEYTDAAGSFRNATRQNPRDYQAFYHLGASYEQLGQYQQAIQAYKAGLDTQSTSLAGQEDYPFRVTLMDGLASAIAKSDERDIELNQVEQQAQSENNADTRFLLAKIYRNRGDVDMAVDNYNRAALLEPENFFVAKEYGLYLEQVGQTNRAIVPLKKAYVLNDEDPEVGQALLRLGIVPGPSLRDTDQLAQPAIPKGPLPEMDWERVGVKPRTNPDTAPTPTLAPTADTQAPRD